MEAAFRFGWRQGARGLTEEEARQNFQHAFEPVILDGGLSEPICYPCGSQIYGPATFKSRIVVDSTGLADCCICGKNRNCARIK